MRSALINNGLPYYLDTDTGKYISAITGREYESLASLAATDKPTYTLYRQLAGRDVDHRELTNGATADPVDEDDRYRGHNVTATTTGYEPPSAAQRARKAADHMRLRNVERSESPGERAVRLAEETAARLESEESAAAERAELAARPETRKNVAKARELQRRHQFLAGKKRSTLDKCERAVELASSGQTVEFDRLYSQLNGMLVDHLQSKSQARFEELTSEIDEVNHAIGALA